MRLFVLIWVILLFVLTVAFILFNLNEYTHINLYFRAPYMYKDVPLSFVVIFSVLFGVIYTGIIALAEGMNLRINNMKLKKTIKKLEAEIDQLKGISFSPEAEGQSGSAPYGELK